MAKDFQENKWVKFTPHYLVWQCPSSYAKSRECKSQCIRQGRYCTPDPDGDLTEGYSGSDIVQVRRQSGPCPPTWPPRLDLPSAALAEVASAAAVLDVLTHRCGEESSGGLLPS